MIWLCLQVRFWFEVFGGKVADLVFADRYDELFLSKYVEADGNPRHFVHKGLLSTFAP